MEPNTKRIPTNSILGKEMDPVKTKCSWTCLVWSNLTWNDIQQSRCHESLLEVMAQSKVSSNLNTLWKPRTETSVETQPPTTSCSSTFSSLEHNSATKDVLLFLGPSCPPPTFVERMMKSPTYSSIHDTWHGTLLGISLQERHDKEWH